MSVAGLFAQLDTGTINVSVKGASGLLVPGATVVLRDERSGINIRSANTNEQGFYSFTLIPSGSYSVRVERPGFKAYEQSGIVLQVNVQHIQTTVYRLEGKKAVRRVERSPMPTSLNRSSRAM